MRVTGRRLLGETLESNRAATDDVDDLALVLVDLDRAVAEEVGCGCDRIGPLSHSCHVKDLSKKMAASARRPL
jgi:hypothetical protein